MRVGAAYIGRYICLRMLHHALHASLFPLSILIMVFVQPDAIVPLARSAPIQSDIRLLLTLGSCSSRGRIRTETSVRHL